MDAGFVGKGIGTDHGLVRLHREPGDVGDQAAGGDDLRGIETAVAGEQIASRAHRHDHLFERGIASALAQAVNGAFHLARTVEHRGQGVGHRQA